MYRLGQHSILDDILEIYRRLFADDVVGKDFINTRSGTVTRDSDDFITTITKTGGRTITFTRNSDNFITSATDGSRTWTFTRDSDNLLTSWSVAT